MTSCANRRTRATFCLSHAVGVGDVGGALDGVAEGDAVGLDPEAEAEVNLAARGAVELATEGGDGRDHLGGGISP